MKYLYLALLNFFVFSSMGQSLSVTPSYSDSIYLAEDETHVNDFIELTSYLQNDSNVSLDVSWRITDAVIPTGWSMSLCDRVFCLDVTTGNETNQFSLEPDSLSVLKAGFEPSGNVGSGFMKVSVVAIGSGDPALFYAYRLDIGDITGISTFKKTTFSIFPNPSTSVINVNISEVNDIDKIEVYNVIGKRVVEQEVKGVNNKVDISNFENGLYIIKLFSEDNFLFHTQSFIKQ